jgi:anti-sigma-K factor RskA
LDFEIMDYSEDHIALAAEYALGTLDADERAQVETMMSADNDFTGVVRAWEFRLGVLNQMVGAVEPRPELWERIQAAAGLAEPQAPIVLPETPPLPPAPAERIVEPVVPAADNSSVILLSGRARRWRGIARVTSALAAALVAMIGIEIFAPDLLPDVLRPKPRTQVVEVKSPAPAPTVSPQYVALLQGQGGMPAFILTVDGATKTFTVRKIGARSLEPSRSYELWLISDKLPRPRSLGIIGSGDFTARPVLASYDTDVINNATYAVTVEQSGGSPDGAPHSAPVYAGRLIQTVPPG